jgi:hypothetical protein
MSPVTLLRRFGLSLGDEFVDQVNVGRHMGKSAPQALEHVLAAFQYDAVAVLPGDQAIARLEIQSPAKMGRDDQPPLRADSDLVLAVRCSHSYLKVPVMKK